MTEKTTQPMLRSNGAKLALAALLIVGSPTNAYAHGTATDPNTNLDKAGKALAIGYAAISLGNYLNYRRCLRKQQGDNRLIK